MATWFLLLTVLLVIPLAYCDITGLTLENTSPSLVLQQILVSWQSNAQLHGINLTRVKSITSNSTLDNYTKVTTKDKTFEDLEFSAEYKFEVNTLDSNSVPTGTGQTKQIKTAEVPKPVISNGKVQVLMVHVSNAVYSELIVLKVDGSSTKSQLKIPAESSYTVFLYVAVSNTNKAFQVVEVGDNTTSGPTNNYKNSPLLPNTRYSFSQHFRIGNVSVYYPWSDIITTPEALVTVNTGLTSAEIVAVIVGVTAAVIGLVFIIICCFNWKYSLRYKPQPAKGKPANPIQRLVTDPAIPVTEEDFFDHVCQMKLHNFKGFYEEFSSKKYDFKSSEAFRNPDNHGKNRYVNIPCFDHSRVELEGEDEVETYIHANYIPGAYDDKEYIYTQSPLPETVGHFWTMVWEHDCEIIVMIGEMVEKGKQECAPYFPYSEKTSLQTSCKVTLTKVHKTTHYIIRTLVLSKDGVQKKLTHYQYIAWPTKKVTPEYSTSFLQMVLCVSKSIPDRPGKPIVVHGTNDRYGRGGIFTCVDSEIQRFIKQGDLSVFGSVSSCKQHRHDGVKTLDEYIFIHDTILEAVLLKSIDNISVVNLPRYIENASKGHEGKDLFVTEFNFLTSTSMSSTQKMAAASQLCNVAKNRYANIKPYDYNRVKLTKLKNEEGSDYINASYIDTYNSTRLFIAAQAPLVETISDFWRMISENESWVIIMLGQEIENGQLKANRFWPEEGHVMSLEGLTVKFISISRDVIRDVWIRQMELLNEKGERKLIQFYQYHSWPSHESVTSQSIRSLIQLVNQSKGWMQKLNAKIITVVSSSGIGRPGVFIGLRSLQEESDSESSVNVFRTVQKLNQQRPLLVQSREEYALIYTSTLEMTENARRRPIINEQKSIDHGDSLAIEMDPNGNPVVDSPFKVIDMEPSEEETGESDHHHPDPGVAALADNESAKSDPPKEKVPRVGFRLEGDEKPSLGRINSGTNDSGL